MFIRPQNYSAVVQRSSRENHKIIELTLEVTEPPTLEFIPGQFVSLEVGDGVYRSYSISSDPANKTAIRLLIEVGHEGIGSNYAKKLKVGDKVSFIGPSGKFTLPEILSQNLVFVATGTGIAPFEAMVYKLIASNFAGNIDFYFGIRNQEDLFHEDFLEYCSKHLHNFSYYICFSGTNFPTAPNTFSGRVNKVMTETLDLPLICRENNTHFFLCGNPYMIIDMVLMLENNHVNQDKVLFEKFYV